MTSARILPGLYEKRPAGLENTVCCQYFNPTVSTQCHAVMGVFILYYTQVQKCQQGNININFCHFLNIATVQFHDRFYRKEEDLVSMKSHD